MSFTSISFIFFFFPICIILYSFIKNCKHKIQNIFLLIASLIFYAWCGLQYVILLFVEVIINYFLGTIFSKESISFSGKKLFLVMGVIVNISLLGIFKYYNFFADLIEATANLLFPQLILYRPNIPLPLGISFIIFQMISYIVDVYNKKIECETSFIDFTLYMLFFPKIVMGPITRLSDMNDDLKYRSFDGTEFNRGIVRFCFGFIKKILLANQVAILADAIFDMQGGNNFIIAWIGAIAYTLQIYIDFSAYTDMAIGLAKIFGFNLPENFDYPYCSKSIQEFWRRWHISLSSWFRDYVYIPLGGNRVAKWKIYRNLGIVFLSTGLWHGANLTFVIWGLYHGVFLILERVKMREILNKIPSVLSHLYTMIIIIIGWVFFRAENLSVAIKYIRSMFSINLNIWQLEFWKEISIESILFFTISIFICIPHTKKESKSILKNYVILIILFIVSIYYLLTNDFNPFIYLRF